MASVKRRMMALATSVSCQYDGKDHRMVELTFILRLGRCGVPGNEILIVAEQSISDSPARMEINAASMGQLTLVVQDQSPWNQKHRGEAWCHL